MNEDYHTIIMEILSNLSSFYRIKKTNKKKIENFILTKSIEIDIHEIMARIYNNLTKENGLCQNILKEISVFDDIIDFLSKLSGSNKTKENKEFILSIIEKKKKSNVDPKKSISNIVEYSLAAIKNILLSGPDYEEYSKFMANVYNQLNLD